MYLLWLEVKGNIEGTAVEFSFWPEKGVRLSSWDWKWSEHIWDFAKTFPLQYPLVASSHFLRISMFFFGYLYEQFFLNFDFVINLKINPWKYNTYKWNDLALALFSLPILQFLMIHFPIFLSLFFIWMFYLVFYLLF